jgi:hypothetical protein
MSSLCSGDVTASCDNELTPCIARFERTSAATGCTCYPVYKEIGTQCEAYTGDDACTGPKLCAAVTGGATGETSCPGTFPPKAKDTLCGAPSLCRAQPVCDGTGFTCPLGAPTTDSCDSPTYGASAVDACKSGGKCAEGVCTPVYKDSSATCAPDTTGKSAECVEGSCSSSNGSCVSSDKVPGSTCSALFDPAAEPSTEDAVCSKKVCSASATCVVAPKYTTGETLPTEPCRASAGDCDKDDYCVAGSATCTDTFAAAETSCAKADTAVCKTGGCNGSGVCGEKNLPNGATDTTRCTAAEATIVGNVCKKPECSAGACVGVNDKQGEVCQIAVDSTCTPTLTCDEGECGGSTQKVCAAQPATGRRFYA